MLHCPEYSHVEETVETGLVPTNISSFNVIRQGFSFRERAGWFASRRFDPRKHLNSLACARAEALQNEFVGNWRAVDLPDTAGWLDLELAAFAGGRSILRSNMSEQEGTRISGSKGSLLVETAGRRLVFLRHTRFCTDWLVQPARTEAAISLILLFMRS